MTWYVRALTTYAVFSGRARRKEFRWLIVVGLILPVIVLQSLPAAAMQVKNDPIARFEASLRADANTIYRIGSISKSVTAVILMQLVERGVVRLDDPVVLHLPEFALLGGGVPEAATITLCHLASHTGGLVREPAPEDAAAGPIEQWEDKVIASIPTTTLRSVPGTGYAYSNIGFGILGLALRTATTPGPWQATPL